eukprot:gene32777-33839_t
MVIGSLEAPKSVNSWLLWTLRNASTVANNHGHRISGSTQIGELMATMDTKECQHCGDYGPWDNESEWQEKWTDWDSKLAYYDRRYDLGYYDRRYDLGYYDRRYDLGYYDRRYDLGYYDRRCDRNDQLMEDLANEGNMDEDTPHMDDVPPAACLTGTFPETDRLVAKMEKQQRSMLIVDITKHRKENLEIVDITKPMKETLEAIVDITKPMKENLEAMDLFRIVDITKPMKENLEAMDLFRADLPPELHPEAFPDFSSSAFPEYLLMANSPTAAFNNEFLTPEAFPEYLLIANSPIAAFNNEYLIMKNLDAALRDSPKPACFAPSAGTVACPACDAHPTYYSFTPNLKKLFKAEQPFWLKTLNNMQQQGTWTRALPTAQGADMGIRAPYEEEMVPSGRQYGEIPRKQYADVEIEEAMKSTAPGLHLNIPFDGNQVWDHDYEGGWHLNIPFNGNQVWDHDYEGGWFGHSNKVEGPDGIQGRGPGMPMPADNGDLITEVMEQDFGPGDPLNDFSYSRAKGRKTHAVRGGPGMTMPADNGDLITEVMEQNFGPGDPLNDFSYGRAKGRKTHAANPLTNNSAAEAEWFYSNMNPAKNLARKVRDLRVLGTSEF